MRPRPPNHPFTPSAWSDPGIGGVIGEAQATLPVATASWFRRQHGAGGEDEADVDVEAVQLEMCADRGRIRIVPELKSMGLTRDGGARDRGLVVIVLRRRAGEEVACVTLSLSPDATSGSREWLMEAHIYPTHPNDHPPPIS